MKLKKTFLISITVCSILLMIGCAVTPRKTADTTASSPSGKIKIELQNNDQLTLSVTAFGRTVMAPSPFELQFKDQPAFGKGLKIVDVNENYVSDSWKTVWGTERITNDEYTELTVELTETQAPGRTVVMILRAYDDGVAFRYALPKQKGLETFELLAENMHFNIPSNATFWAANFGGFVSHQEDKYTKRNMDEMLNGQIYGIPATIRLGSKVYAAITEAHIDNWAGMYLTADNVTLPFEKTKGAPPKTRKPGATMLKSILSPLPEQNISVKASTPHQSPWRVILLGQKPTDLVASNLVATLNPPSKIADTSWIKPGPMAWDHWWSGDVVMTTKTIKDYIQLAADMDWPYMLIDWQWYGRFNKPDSDPTTVNPAVDMDQVRRFAKEKGIDLWLWLYWTDIEHRYEEAFALYEKWDIKGVKIDFMQRDDQLMVNWYRDVIKCAAKHKLMVNYHGAYKPDGIRRTWPNMLTREGVLANEYNKWSTSVTASHNCTLPFTRMLAGPMDCTPGGFINRQPDQFKPQKPTQVQTTRCQQLAMLIVYETPLICICDHPDNYKDQPGSEFMKSLPTDWNKTVVLNGEIGQYITIARRNGADWYLGSMTNESPRTLNVKLDFLGTGRYKATIYADGKNAAKDAEQVAISTRTVTAKDTLKIKMAPSGGYTAKIIPIP